MRRQGPFRGQLAKALTGLTLLTAVLAGCVAKPDRALVGKVDSGQYGQARTYVASHLTQDRSKRSYLLDRLRLAIVTLGDGYVSDDRTIEQVYDVLRTQGINKDKTVASVVINEDLKFWKGEPFEQAMAFHYVGLHYAMQGSWDNLRAAVSNSLFHLKDFGTDSKGRRLDSEDLIRKAQAQGDQVLEHGYKAVKSTFALGYLMTAAAARELDRPTEMEENLAGAVASNPQLKDVAGEIRKGDYNVLLVVDFGQGPQKIATGPDNAIARFVPQTPSDTRRLAVTTRPWVSGTTGRSELRLWPAACDVNRMAADHMWNNLEDVRQAKSAVGTLLTAGGAGAGLYGLGSRNETATYVGLGLLAAGLFAKAGAHADTTYCEVLPQRVYVAPVRLSPGQVIEVQVEGMPASRLVLAGLEPPQSGTALRYVRLISTGAAPPTWATSGQIYYLNDAAPATVSVGLPYILGGNCVRQPTGPVLDSYQRAGHLRGMSLQELESLYRLEGIPYGSETPIGQPGLHVLEGGRSLAPPLPGTTGFARLFGQVHPPYQPRNSEVKERLAADERR